MVMETAWAEQPARNVRLLTVPQGAKRLGISESKVWQLMAAGRLRSVKIDNSRRIPDDAVDEFIAGLPSASAQRAS